MLHLRVSCVLVVYHMFSISLCYVYPFLQAQIRVVTARANMADDVWSKETHSYVTVDEATLVPLAQKVSTGRDLVG